MINEDKQSRDLRAKKRAERKLKRAEKLYSKGKDKRADKKVARAEELVDNIDTIKTDNLKSEISDIKKIDYTKEFDIINNLLGKGFKIKDFNYLKRFKIKGDDISPDELRIFLNDVSEYIEKNYSDIKDLKDNTSFKSLEIIPKRSKILFRYRESFFDKIKLYIKKNDFTSQNKENIISEINQLKTSKTVSKEVKKDYKEKSEIPIPISNSLIDKKIDQIIEPSVERIINKTNDFINIDNKFVNDAVKLLIEEELYKSVLSNFNVDEDRIFNFFVTQNTYKTLNPTNVDAICRLYKQKTNVVSENVLSAIKRSTKGLLGKKSEGFVKDMIYAFNTDTEVLMRDMNKILNNLNNKYSKKIEDELIDTIKQNKEILSIKESMENVDMNLVNSYAKKISNPKSKSKKLIDVMELLTRGSKNIPKKGIFSKISNIVAKKGALKLGTKLLTKGALRAVLLPLRFIPVSGWIIGAAIEGVAFWYKMDEQQNQVATIFTLMYLSKSQVFMNEMRSAGVNVVDKPLNLDLNRIENEI